jgi:hypothetical protein
MNHFPTYTESEQILLTQAKTAHYPLCKANTMAHGTGGVLYHAHNHDNRGGCSVALCGTKPGRRGYWGSYFGKTVTCPRCLKIIEKTNHA